MILHIRFPPEFMADVKSIAESLQVIADAMKPDPPVRAEILLGNPKSLASPEPTKE